MIKLPRKVEYGLISLIHMAEMSPGAVTTTRKMAGQYHLPQELLGRPIGDGDRGAVTLALHGQVGPAEVPQG